MITKEKNICSSEPELDTSFEGSDARYDERSLSREVGVKNQVTEMDEVHYPVSAKNSESGRTAPGAADVEPLAKIDEILTKENEILASRYNEAENGKMETIEHSARSEDESDLSESDDSQNYFEDSSETETTDEDSMPDFRKKS